MDISNINYSNNDSGASIAVNRINNMLNKNGLKSEIISFNDKKNITNSLKIRLFINKVLKKIISKFFNIKINDSINFGILPSNFYKKINKSKAKIINLHWLGNEIISIKQISKIKGPVIWTLHDMWPYTSIEHYIDEKKFIDNYTENKNDLNFILKFIFDSKIKYFKPIKILICTSRWQLKMAQKSLIFKNTKKVLVPLPIDFKIWKPKSKNIARKNLNIQENRKVILFILSHKYAHKRKGLNYVINYLSEIKKENITLITINCENLKLKNEKIHHINFNYLNEIDDKINLYSCSDVFLMPSKIESFGQTALEAQACNCPTVTFKNTGCEDIVDHLKTGYISEYMDQEDFSRGINFVLNSKFGENFIRDTAKKKFSEEIIASKYKEIFKEIF